MFGQRDVRFPSRADISKRGSAGGSQARRHSELPTASPAAGRPCRGPGACSHRSGNRMTVWRAMCAAPPKSDTTSDKADCPHAINARRAVMIRSAAPAVFWLVREASSNPTVRSARKSSPGTATNEATEVNPRKSGTIPTTRKYAKYLF